MSSVDSNYERGYPSEDSNQMENVEGYALIERDRTSITVGNFDSNVPWPWELKDLTEGQPKHLKSKYNYNSKRMSSMISVVSNKLDLKRVSVMTTREKLWHFGRNHLLRLFLSVGVGVLLGLYLKNAFSPLSKRHVMYIRFLGEIFKNILNVITLPLVVFSLVTGITSLDMKTSKKISLATMFYYLLTTIMAAVTGIALALAISPGHPDLDVKAAAHSIKGPSGFIEHLLDVVRQMFPPNIIIACHMKTYTQLVPKFKVMTEDEMTKQNSNETIRLEYIPQLVNEKGSNLIGLVVISIALGIAIHKLEGRGEPLIDIVRSSCEMIISLMNVLIWIAPIGILSLVTAQVAEIDDISKLVSIHALYLATVVTGLIVHGFATLPFLYFVVVRNNPILYLKGLIQAIMTGLGTASSAVALPVVMQNLKDNQIDNRIISFVAPVGAVVNMDGTALYLTVASIFICQYRNENLDVYRLTTICITSVAAAIGTAGVPQGSLACVGLVLSSIGLNSEDIGILMSLDWILDRLATVVNIMGDAFGAGIVEKVAEIELYQTPPMKSLRINDARHGSGLFGRFSTRWGSRTITVNTEISKSKAESHVDKELSSTTIQ